MSFAHPDAQRCYLRDYRAVARDLGICRDCQLPVALRQDGQPGVRCERHAAVHREQVRAYGHRARARRRQEAAERDRHDWRAQEDWGQERCWACAMTRTRYRNGGYVYRALGGAKSTKAPACPGSK